MPKLRSIGTVVGLAALLASPVASANLLINGSFEQSPELTQAGGDWGFFDPSKIDGWESATNNIEIWSSNFNSVKAADGSQFAELNAHPETTGSAFTLFQKIDTKKDESYHLSFAYRARNGGEKFKVEAGGFIQTITNNNKDSWTTYSGMFTALSDETTLMFTSVDPDTETLGNFLDKVSIVAKVTEPGTLALLGLGLAGLGVSRRRRS